MLLQLHGHAVTTPLNGLDVLALARESHSSVVFLDIGLPGIEGYEVARTLRADKAQCLRVAITGVRTERGPKEVPRGRLRLSPRQTSRSDQGRRVAAVTEHGRSAEAREVLSFTNAVKSS